MANNKKTFLFKYYEVETKEELNVLQLVPGSAPPIVLNKEDNACYIQDAETGAWHKTDFLTGPESSTLIYDGGSLD